MHHLQDTAFSQLVQCSGWKVRIPVIHERRDETAQIISRTLLVLSAICYLLEKSW